MYSLKIFSSLLLLSTFCAAGRFSWLSKKLGSSNVLERCIKEAEEYRKTPTRKEAQDIVKIIEENYDNLSQESIQKCLEVAADQLFANNSTLYEGLYENKESTFKLDDKPKVYRAVRALAIDRLDTYERIKGTYKQIKNNVLPDKNNGFILEECEKEVREYMESEESSKSTLNKKKEAQDVIDVLKAIDTENARTCAKSILGNSKYKTFNKKLKKPKNKSLFARLNQI